MVSHGSGGSETMMTVITTNATSATTPSRLSLFGGLMSIAAASQLSRAGQKPSARLFEH
jgi:hypothetical protein